MNIELCSQSSVGCSKWKNEPFITENISDQIANTVPKYRYGLKDRLKAIFWDSLDKSAEEKRLLLKLDMCILTYAFYGYFMRTLDQTNLSNAYVSGMKKDLNMSDNQYNFCTTWFYIGYCIGLFPSQVIITYNIKPSIWLPTCQLIWSCFVMAIAGAKNIKSVYVFRFFVGLFESTAHSGMVSILSSWYKKDELGKRAGIFQSSISIASMVSGYLQAGLHSHMNGRLGLHSWQWVFIFDGIIAFPVIVFGYFAIPDSPYNSTVFWLTPAEKQLSMSRMLKVGRAPGKKTLLFKRDILQVWKSWHFYLFTIILSCHTLTNKLGNYLNLYLKSTGKYSITQIDVIPTGGYALQFVSCLSYAWISDTIQKRWPVLIGACTIALTGDLILSIWPANNSKLIIFAWFLVIMLSPSVALIPIWLTELITYSAEQRQITLGLVEAFAFQFSAWVPLLIFSSADAPHYPYGFFMVILFMGLEIAVVLLIAYLAYRDEQNGTQQKRIDAALKEYSTVTLCEEVV